MPYADLLHPILLRVVELVHVPIYLLQAHVILEVTTKIVDRSFLAHGLTDTPYNQVAEFLILDLIEPDAVIDLADDRLGCRQTRRSDTGQNILGRPQFLIGPAFEVNQLLAAVRGYPMPAFGLQGGLLLLAMGDAHPVNLLEAAAALVDDNHTDGPGTVMLPAGKHTAKVRKSLASPKSPEKYALQLCERPFFRKQTGK